MSYNLPQHIYLVTWDSHARPPNSKTRFQTTTHFSNDILLPKARSHLPFAGLALEDVGVHRLHTATLPGFGSSLVENCEWMTS